MKTNCLFTATSAVALAALLFVPVSVSADSILLTSSNFGLLGSTAITNTNNTNITIGDVGSAVAVTGFPPGIVTNGAVIRVSDGVVAQAQLDLITASVGLAGMTPDTVLTGQDLGGMTLLPGVYRFAADATQALSTALTLDANGQNNAYWVFQINGTFTSGANTAVNFVNPGTNGGSDNGIFWNIQSSVTFGANDQILGNYLAGTAFTFGAAAGGTGRALAQTGIALDNNAINPFGGPAGSDWTGGLMYGPGGAVVPVPEPAAFLWLASVSAIGLVLWRRRQSGTNSK